MAHQFVESCLPLLQDAHQLPGLEPHDLSLVFILSAATRLLFSLYWVLRPNSILLHTECSSSKGFANLIHLLFYVGCW